VNDSLVDVIAQFRESLSDCKRLYIQAARVALQDQPGADDTARRELIRRMVDLHQGLLVKIYTSVARADQKWSEVEQQLACELVDHLWQQRLAGKELNDIAQRMFRDAGRLAWYSLLRPFDRIVKIRNFVPELETVVLRVANLVAKADGCVAVRETDAIRAIQQEIQVHLCRLQLEETPPGDSPQRAEAPAEIVHREPPRLESQHTQQQQKQLRLPDDAVETDSATLSDSLQQALQVVAPDGEVQLVGMPSNVSLELTSLWHRETCIRGCYAYTHADFATAMDVVRAHDLGHLVSATYPLKDYTDAIAHAAAAGRRGAVKIAFDMRGKN